MSSKYRMQKADSNIRAAVMFIGSLIIAAGIFCRAGVLTQSYAQDTQATIGTSSSSIKTGNSSFNYLSCDKNQNKEVITENLDTPEAIGPAPAVMGMLTSLAVPAPGPSLNADVIFNLINDYRTGLGLPKFEKEDKLCQLAQVRAPEGISEVFVSGKIHSGLYNRNIPFWITENMKYGTSEVEVFNWWLHSYIHKKAIESSHKYSCGACSGNLCVQEFTNYQPK